ncbi:MAG: hypothetical protein IIB27_08125 [Chloroflexi bacterium]|nr:hypothetical protein [Chloroflexota bacterium]
MTTRFTVAHAPDSGRRLHRLMSEMRGRCNLGGPDRYLGLQASASEAATHGLATTLEIVSAWRTRSWRPPGTKCDRWHAA